MMKLGSFPFCCSFAFGIRCFLCTIQTVSKLRISNADVHTAAVTCCRVKLILIVMWSLPSKLAVLKTACFLNVWLLGVADFIFIFLTGQNNALMHHPHASPIKAGDKKEPLTSEEARRLSALPQSLRSSRQLCCCLCQLCPPRHPQPVLSPLTLCGTLSLPGW